MTGWQKCTWEGEASAMMRIERLESGYGGGSVLRELSMTIHPGEVVCLMGRNGVGKTTLMRTIMGLLKTKQGTIRLNGRDITRMPPYLRARAGIGYVPQGRDIFPHLTVYDNLLLGLESAPGSGGGVPDSIYAMFPVLKEMLKRKGGDLSGGQQQQLAIARALMGGPKLLLLDEPTEGIQPSIVLDIERVIESVKSKGDTSILLVEQSLEFVSRIADRYYIMDKGALVAEGKGDSVTATDMRRHLAV